VLSGPHFGIARLVHLRRIGSGAEGLLDLPAYVGPSAGAGNVWQRRGDASLASARKVGAAVVGIDTPLGPVQLGAGCDQAGVVSYFLLPGPTF
jgi:NTE family protein